MCRVSAKSVLVLWHPVCTIPIFLCETKIIQFNVDAYITNERKIWVQKREIGEKYIFVNTEKERVSRFIPHFSNNAKNSFQYRFLERE